MAENCDIKIVFKEPEKKICYLNEEISGVFMVQSLENLEIETLGYRLVMETRGRIVRKEIYVINKVLLNDITLIAHENYSFDFAMINPSLETYNGSNVSFSYRFEVWVQKRGKFYKKDPKGLIEKIGNKLNFNSELTKRHYLIFRAKDKKLSLHPNSTDLYLTSDFFIPLVILMLFPMLFVIFADGMYVIRAIVLLLVIGLINWFAIKKAGTSTIKFDNAENDNFSFKFGNSNNWKGITSISTAYAIREDVVDKRGTSPETFTKIIYTSYTKTKENPTGEVEFLHPTPKKQPPSMQAGDAKIYYVAIVTIKMVMGIQLDMESVFIVDRKSFS